MCFRRVRLSTLWCMNGASFFFKQKTAYEMRISDWSSDVCSADLVEDLRRASHLRRRDEADGGPLRTLCDRRCDQCDPSQDRRPGNVHCGRGGCADRRPGRQGTGEGQPQGPRQKNSSQETGKDRKSTRLNSNHQCPSTLTTFV